VRILDPFGKEIYQSTARGRLLEQGGGKELFVESVEPELVELPLEAFFAIFPAGTYTFVGRSPDGERLVSTAEFTHDIPAGPEIVMPAGAGGEECAENVPIPAVIAWNDVSTTIDGEPIDIVRYQVIVEHEDLEFSVFLDADGGTSVTVPSEFLTAGTDYIFEVLASEEGGNQTISEGCFATSD